MFELGDRLLRVKRGGSRGCAYPVHVQDHLLSSGVDGAAIAVALDSAVSGRCCSCIRTSATWLHSTTSQTISHELPPVHGHALNRATACLHTETMCMRHMDAGSPRTHVGHDARLITNIRAWQWDACAGSPCRSAAARRRPVAQLAHCSAAAPLPSQQRALLPVGGEAALISTRALGACQNVQSGCRCVFPVLLCLQAWLVY
jgi:hypothetical protein